MVHLCQKGRVSQLWRKMNGVLLIWKSGHKVFGMLWIGQHFDKWEEWCQCEYKYEWCHYKDTNDLNEKTSWTSPQKSTLSPQLRTLTSLQNDKLLRDMGGECILGHCVNTLTFLFLILLFVRRPPQHNLHWHKRESVQQEPRWPLQGSVLNISIVAILLYWVENIKENLC